MKKYVRPAAAVLVYEKLDSPPEAEPGRRPPPAPAEGKARRMAGRPFSRARAMPHTAAETTTRPKHWVLGRTKQWADPKHRVLGPTKNRPRRSTGCLAGRKIGLTEAPGAWANEKSV
ncbi:MAG TPA: hypothetical protein VFS43_42360 [Polyangiaceae bacterium]|nr:hypothetical protein [Polyangiaceae bacterium]